MKRSANMMELCNGIGIQDAHMKKIFKRLQIPGAANLLQISTTCWNFSMESSTQFELAGVAAAICHSVGNLLVSANMTSIDKCFVMPNDKLYQNVIIHIGEIFAQLVSVHWVSTVTVLGHSVVARVQTLSTTSRPNTVTAPSGWRFGNLAVSLHGF